MQKFCAFYYVISPADYDRTYCFLFLYLYPVLKPNVTQPERSNCEQNFNEESIAEKLKHLKELMDQGVINSEDFEAKKKELLAKM